MDVKDELNAGFNACARADECYLVLAVLKGAVLKQTLTDFQKVRSMNQRPHVQEPVILDFGQFTIPTRKTKNLFFLLYLE
jgi:hypothetical protein